MKLYSEDYAREPEEFPIMTILKQNKGITTHPIVLLSRKICNHKIRNSYEL